VDADVLAEAVDLVRARRAFALATVVWRRSPSSGRAGSKAIVFPDGTMHGWLGGTCAQPTLVREARAALSDGHSRLLFLGPADELGRHEHDGSSTFAMACESEGALQVHIEPFLPVPQLVIVGRSPAVHALTRQARALDWDVDVIDEGGRPDEHPEPERVRTVLDYAALDVGAATAIVVATQGHYDELALAGALGTDASYIGVVAAEKRASVLLGHLRDRGFGEDQLARVHAPAGLDLGAITNAEIAVAVLADLVARRAAGTFSGVDLAPPPREAIDPVCGMHVFADDARYTGEYAGTRFWFCSAGCLRRFEADPAAFATAARSPGSDAEVASPPE
jgi:xanthine dehydrogenase accessory factor